jgi:adenosylhomocysteine nucleosidase
LGERFATSLEVAGHATPVIFVRGGWGKIDAAASTLYAIDRWSLSIVVNLGTCRPHLAGDDLPQPVQCSPFVAGDANLDPAPIVGLHKRCAAVAGDRESDAIARIAARNVVPCLIRAARATW